MPPKSQVVFSAEDDSKLAELVSMHPCIYNLQHEFYKNVGVRDNVWSQIADEMGKSVDECKKRWKNMKDTYNKNKKARKLGTGSSSNKPSKWQLTDVLSFLDACPNERDGLSNIQSSTNENDSNTSEVEPDVLVVDDDFQLHNVSSSQNTADQMSHSENSTSEKRKLLNEKSIIKKSKNDEFVMLLKKSAEERKTILNVLNNDEEEDQIDAFFKSMALTVKAFSPNLQIRAKRAVFNIISDLEEQNTNSMPLQSTQNSNQRSNTFLNLTQQQTEIINSDPTTTRFIQSTNNNLSSHNVYWPPEHNLPLKNLNVQSSLKSGFNGFMTYNNSPYHMSEIGDPRTADHHWIPQVEERKNDNELENHHHREHYEGNK